MASAAAAKSEKRLCEFLKEQQDPFILHVYLVERGYSKRWNNAISIAADSVTTTTSTPTRTRTCPAFIKKRKPLFPFSKLRSALHKKLSFHTHKLTSAVTHSHNAIQHTVAETERFSSATSSTVFNSCSDIDIDIDVHEDATSPSPHRDNKPSFSPDTCHQSQQATNNGKHRQSRIEGFPLPQSLNNEILLNEQQDSGIKRNCGVLVPKKITEDSLLSAALWSLLIQSAKRESYSYKMEVRDILGPNVSQILKSKGVLHKTKQLLFDCVREITIALPKKDDDGEGGNNKNNKNKNKQLMGPEELGRIICERTREWGQQGGGDETNLTHLLTLDYLNSVGEWSKFKQHVRDVAVFIADAILERVNDEIVSDLIQILPTTLSV